MIKLAETYLNINVDGKLKLMEYYNNNCYQFIKKSRKYKIKANDNWCAMFTSVIAHKMGLSPDVFPYEVSVGEQVKLARERGSFTQNVELAKSGDLIIFNWNGDAWPDHVGFVKSVNNGIITTVEGNYRKTVGNRHIAMNSPFIVGIIQL
ncbi:Exo-glucosaminidase lytG precursor [Pectobacterium phage DU_PP_III]|nr:Exo-glucosaminidase lytG precursor [Pectobacterium phage DU_PP_III]